MSDPDDFEDLLENFIGSSPARKSPTEPKNEPVKLEQKTELDLKKAPSPNETSTGKRKVFKIEKDIDWGDDNPTEHPIIGAAREEIKHRFYCHHGWTSRFWKFGRQETSNWWAKI